MNETNGLENLAPGSVRVLNVGAGDLKLTFDSDDPAEVERARRTVEDISRWCGPAVAVHEDSRHHFVEAPTVGRSGTQEERR